MKENMTKNNKSDIKKNKFFKNYKYLSKIDNDILEEEQIKKLDVEEKVKLIENIVK